MSNNVTPTPQELPLTAFGDVSVAELTPEVQVSAVNGLRDDVQQLFGGIGAGVAAVNGNYECTSGTSVGGFSSILTSRFATYRNGQGLTCRLTALFPSNEVGSLQFAGFINGGNAFVFGYLNDVYGLGRAYGGLEELQKLQITTPASGPENATVTVNGVGYTVPLTSGSVEHNAIEIANSLTSQFDAAYTFTANGDTVTALYAVPAPQGAFAFSSSSAVATWTQLVVGTAPTVDWIPFANWSNPPSWTIDPTKGNVYSIKVQYLGYGGIKFYMENPETTLLELVHVYEYSNQHAEPSVTDPSFRVGWAVQSLGTTSSITISGASAMGGVEGKKVFDERGRPISNEIIGLGTTRRHILSIRNRSEIASKPNRVTAYPKLLVLSADHNKAVNFHIDIGTTFADDVIYEYKDEQNSAVEFSKSPSDILSDGREVFTVPVRGTTPLVFDMEKILGWLLPRETLSITAETASGTGAEADAALTWVEDP